MASTAVLDPWIGFLNEEVAERPPIERALGREFLRQTVLDHAACSFPFPLFIHFRGIVMGRREWNGTPHLVVGPAHLSGDALEVVGGILVPSERGLMPGSVVEVSCHLADPDSYALNDGLLALDAHLAAIIPIER